MTIWYWGGGGVASNFKYKLKYVQQNTHTHTHTHTFDSYWTINLQNKVKFHENKSVPSGILLTNSV